MIKTKKLFVLVFLLLNCILFSACSQSKEVDFVKKYKIDLNTISDVTEVLQKAIDELPDDGVLFLQDGTYPLAGRIVFKENMRFKLSDNAILLNCICRYLSLSKPIFIMNKSSLVLCIIL